MLRISKIISSKSKNIVNDNSEYFRNIPYVEMNSSKLIKYSTDVCWNGQGTIMVLCLDSLQGIVAKGILAPE
jgi:hypothetical protein